MHSLQVVLHGPAGIGKTQVAAQYAALYRKSSALPQRVLWFEGHSKSSMIASLYRIVGTEVGLADSSDWTFAQILETVTENLMTRPDVLTVFDGVEVQTDILPFIPRRSAHIVVTTRNPDVWDSGVTAGKCRRIACKGLTRGTAAEMWARFTRLQDGQGVADQLECHPMALSHAGSYVASVQPHYRNSSQVVIDLRHETRSIPSTAAGLHDIPLSVRCAVQLNLRDVCDEASNHTLATEQREVSRAAVYILRHIAFLDSAPIPRIVLEELFKGALPYAGAGMDTECSLRDALDLLEDRQLSVSAGSAEAAAAAFEHDFQPRQWVSVTAIVSEAVLLGLFSDSTGRLLLNLNGENLGLAGDAESKGRKVTYLQKIISVVEKLLDRYRYESVGTWNAVPALLPHALKLACHATDLPMVKKSAVRLMRLVCSFMLEIAGGCAGLHSSVFSDGLSISGYPSRLTRVGWWDGTTLSHSVLSTAIEYAKDSYGFDHPEVGTLLVLQAHAYMSQQRVVEACGAAETASLMLSSDPVYADWSLDASATIHHAHMLQGEWREARDETQALLKGTLPVGCPATIIRALLRAGKTLVEFLLTELRDTETALDVASTVVELLQPFKLPPWHPGMVAARVVEARCFTALEEFDTGLARFNSIVEDIRSRPLHVGTLSGSLSTATVPVLCARAILRAYASVSHKTPRPERSSFAVLAVGEVEDALQAAEGVLGRDSLTAGQILLCLSTVQRIVGRATEAVDSAKEARVVLALHHGEACTEVSEAALRLAQTYLPRSVLSAVEHFEEAYSTALRTLAKEAQVGVSSGALKAAISALLYCGQLKMIVCDDAQAAGQHYSQATEVLREYAGRHPALNTVRVRLADTLRQTKSRGKAAQLYQACVEVYRQMLDAYHPMVAECYRGLAEMAQDSGEHSSAIQYWESVVRTAGGHTASNRGFSVGKALDGLGMCWALTRRPGEAIQALKQAEAVKQIWVDQEGCIAGALQDEAVLVEALKRENSPLAQLAHTYSLMGFAVERTDSLVESMLWYEKSASAYQESLGPHHPSTQHVARKIDGLRRLVEKRG